MTSAPGLPPLFVKLLGKLMPLPDNDTIYSAFSRRPPAVRINTLKTDAGKVKTYFREQNIPFEEVPWSSTGLLLPLSDSKDITSLPLYRSGGIFIQTLSSMIPALVMNAKPGETVLDMAAAPGTKTTQLAAMMKNTGTIIANDVDINRIYRLKAVLATQGVINTTVSKLPGQALWKKYPEYFDRVLLDAPCSMEGRFVADYAKSYSHWSPKKVKNLGKLQKWLLRSAISAVREGGTVVYSTCTLSPEENEEVIDWILQKEKGKVEVADIDIHGLKMQNGITQWEGRGFNPALSRTRRIIPSAHMEGFYVALLRKVAKSVYA